MIKVIGVRFRKAGKVYYFDPAQMEIKMGDHVIVETARGIEFGEVVLGVREVDEKKVIQPLKSVIRMATKNDEEISKVLSGGLAVALAVICLRRSKMLAE